jgi:hypothetical protein
VRFGLELLANEDRRNERQQPEQWTVTDFFQELIQVTAPKKHPS